MAEEETDQEEGAIEETGQSKKKLFIIVGAVAGVILIAAGLFFTGVFDEPAPVESEVAEQVEGDESEAAEDEPADVPIDGAILYHDLAPPFMVNFQKTSIRVVKLAITVMTASSDVLDAVKTHDPLIRNNILLTLASQDPEELKSTEGKKSLQSLIKDEINKVLADQKINQTVKQVFFTELVMQ